MEDRQSPVRPDQRDGIFYAVTNESPAAVIAGLDITRADEILMIGADQAFAALQFANLVIIEDKDPYYLETVKERKALLAAGDDEGFLNLDTPNDPVNVFLKRRNAYFREPSRLPAIRKQLFRLTIAEPGDIIEYAESHPRFHKIYVSNAIGSGKYSQTLASIEALNRLSKILDPQDLIYVTAHYPNWESELSADLQLDEELSEKAKRFEQTEFWNPRVYRKMS